MVNAPFISSSDAVDTSSVITLNMHMILPERKPIISTRRKFATFSLKTSVRIALKSAAKALNFSLEESLSSSVNSRFGIVTVTSKTISSSAVGRSVSGKVVGFVVSTTITSVISKDPIFSPSAS